MKIAKKTFKRLVVFCIVFCMLGENFPVFAQAVTAEGSTARPLVEENAGKTALSAELGKALKIKQYLYTSEAAGQLQKAIDNAQSVISGGIRSQASADEALNKLAAAQANLVTVKYALLEGINKGKAKQNEENYGTSYADYSRKLLDDAVTEAEKWYKADDEDLTESQEIHLVYNIDSALLKMDKVPSLNKNDKGQYTISSPEDLRRLGQDVKNGACLYYDRKIVITQDIDMQGEIIGVNNENSSKSLQADIDGCKHSILNYGDITSSAFPKMDMSSKKSIKNLTINYNTVYQDGAGIKAPSTFSAWCYDGGSPILENCITNGIITLNTDDLSGNYYAVHAFGYYSSLKNCYSRVNFNVTGEGTDKTINLSGLNGYKDRASDSYYAGTMDVDLSKFIKAEAMPVQEETKELSGVYYDKNIFTYQTDYAAAACGKATAELKNKESGIYADYDFENVWEISPEKNDGYPTLKQVNITRVKVKPILEPKLWNKKNPKDTAAVVKEMSFYDVDDATQQLIDKYNVKIAYEVESANYEKPKGASKVNIRFKTLKLTYDDNDETAFAIDSVADVNGNIADPDMKSADGKSTLNWSYKLGNTELTGITDAKTPSTAAEFKELWKYTISITNGGEDWENIPGTPVVAGDYTFCHINKNLYKFNTRTGELLGIAECPYGGGAYFTYSIFADGKILVPGGMPVNGNEVSGYTVFDADTLKQLYYINAEYLTEYRGKLYGTDADDLNNRKNSTFAVYSLEDQNTESSDEILTPQKIYKSGNYNISMPYPVFNGDYALAFNGQAALALNLETGELTKSGTIAKAKDSDGQLNYYEKNSRVYIATKTTTGDFGSVYSVVFKKSDGTFDMSTLKTFNSDVAYGSNSVPIIYNDRLYLCGGGHFMGGGDPFRVFDANTLKPIYSIPALGSKASAMLTTAYATKENNQTVYIYIVPYAPDPADGKSKVYIIKDSIGQTQASYEAADAGVTQYASQSVAFGKDGELVWYNDGKYLYSYGFSDASESVYTAEDVMRQIDRLPETDEYGYYNDFEIRRIKERYDNLNSEEKRKVANISKLEQIIQVLAQEPVDRLIKGIDTIADLNKLTPDDSSKVSYLWAVYNNLDAGSQGRVTNAQKLLDAQVKIAGLQNSTLADTVIKHINGLPDIKDLVSDDKVKVSTAAAEYNDLSDELKDLITNKDKLTLAQERIEAIEKQMEDVKTLINQTLSNVTVNLENRDLILAVDVACKGLAQADIYKIPSYEMYVSPAKVDIVNLFIEKYFYINGKKAVPSESNMKELLSVSEEIDYYYGGIIESDKKYVGNYDKYINIKKSLSSK